MGQGSTEEADERPGDRPALKRSVPVWMAVVLMVVSLAVGYLVSRPSVPLDSSADAGFLRDMSVHHSQAVDMSLIILEETDEPTLSTVAEDIARTQQAQIGRMRGWLVQWDLSIRGGQPSMAWMEGHGHGGGESDEAGSDEPMPGYVSDERMTELREASGREAEVIFLTEMIHHHVGGVDMAEAATTLAEEPVVVEIASGMVEAQRSEIELMQDMLEERGAERVDID
ncbi:DUF305 domain-containing protein [Halostreptopolyspora alba]|uniref:DUF305 domain-containing protein n=1 Tax=Halostreptopolyspora alba TaxID=2487137 RepID=A0A3N0EAH7_9ACTN|nr:DUF305 domain-containing protein [Nocardiopsaceae bacterium YIM 96095]